ncbi:MAG: protein arginine kinase [Planctomycetota bacterium]
MLSPGPEHDVVISTRVRLARNVAGQPFPGRATKDPKNALRERLESAISAIADTQNAAPVRLTESDPLLRQFLKERHLISREHADGNGDGRAVVFTDSEAVSIMINEEDHLRIQAIRSGFQLDDAWASVNRIDDELAARVDYAFHDTYGYLTACPTNVGTGLRAGVMVHLPALFIQHHVEKVVQAAQKMGMVLRGFYGEGSAPHGHIFQVSNQVTLGRSEAELLADLARLIPRVVEYERKMREVLMTEQREKTMDRIFRSVGALTNARMMGSDEAMRHLSDLRLGIMTGLLKGLTLPVLTELFVLIQPGHLQRKAGLELETEARDKLRAEFIRDRLTAIERN